jgi:hypothetical protein
MLGEDLLRRRVVERCGDPGEVFAPYGHKFGRWLDARPDTPPDDELVEVQSAVAAYLDVAAREGRQWGTALGLAFGLAGALVAFLLVWAVS